METLRKRWEKFKPSTKEYIVVSVPFVFCLIVAVVFSIFGVNLEINGPLSK